MAAPLNEIYPSSDEESANQESGGGHGYNVRVLEERDLPAVVSIDLKAQGHAREAYYQAKFNACVRDPGINTSLVAENDGAIVGFLFGRLFFGEFGVPMERAVLDSIGVHPSFAGQHVAAALVAQYRLNMEALRVEAIDTLVGWNRFELLRFFQSAGFKPSRDVDLVWDLRQYPFQGGSTQVRVRNADPSDLKAVLAIDGELLDASRRRYLEARVEAALKRPERNCFVVAELGGAPDTEIVGYLVSTLYHGEFGIDESRGALEAIGVHEDHRGAGTASAMLEAVLNWLHRSNVQYMETLCHWNDWNLLRYFEYVGFRPSARVNLEWRISR